MWLKQCLDKHDACPKPTPYLPSRVIDVGPGDGSQEPYLLETTNVTVPAEEKRYVALSHCWGKDRFLVTRPSNIEAHRKAIPFNALPPSFQHAVTATRQIGQRYLWIDSLCIIQAPERKDITGIEPSAEELRVSEEDWEKESVQMCNIYQHALITITSAHASSAFGGMFKARDGTLVLPFEIVIPLPDREAHFLFTPMPRRETVWDLGDLPIYTRAWCFQELVLSIRTLIFDPDAQRWECLSMYGSERAPEGGIGRHSTRIRELQKAITEPNLHGEIFERFGDCLQNQAKGWHHVVEDYSLRGLTRYIDKLIAVAGVAEAVQRRTTKQYLAGLWKHQLYMDLLWFCRHLKDPISRKSNYTIVQEPPPYREKDAVAPSWSWASVAVPVVYELSVFEQPMCDIIDAQVCGPLHRQAGSITLRADTRTLYVMNSSTLMQYEKQRIEQSDKYRYKSQYDITRHLFVADTGMLISSSTPKLLSSAQIVPVYWMPEEVIDPAIPLTFVAIGYRPFKDGSKSYELRRPEVHTLALIPTGKAKAEYKRVGYAAWEDCTWFGYNCAEDRHLTRETYNELGRSWGRIKPPILEECGGHTHPAEGHLIESKPLVEEAMYHPSTRMERTTLTII